MSRGHRSPDNPSIGDFALRVQSGLHELPFRDSWLRPSRGDQIPALKGDTMSNRRLFGRFALLPALAAVLGPALYGQESDPPRGMVEIGVRGLAGNRDSSQFSQYRSL